MIGDAGPAGATCSRAGCDSPASSAVNWRNPKIHGEDRVKVWLACAEHVDYLEGFLLARNFPVAVGAIGEDTAPVAVRDGQDRGATP